MIRRAFISTFDKDAIQTLLINLNSMKIHRNLELHLETTCFRLSHMLAFHDESLDADLHLKIFNPVYILP
jgi:hypothetical protein